MGLNTFNAVISKTEGWGWGGLFLLCGSSLSYTQIRFLVSPRLDRSEIMAEVEQALHDLELRYVALQRENQTLIKDRESMQGLCPVYLNDRSSLISFDWTSYNIAQMDGYRTELEAARQQLTTVEQRASSVSGETKQVRVSIRLNSTNLIFLFGMDDLAWERAETTSPDKRRLAQSSASSIRGVRATARRTTTAGGRNPDDAEQT